MQIREVKNIFNLPDPDVIERYPSAPDLFTCRR